MIISVRVIPNASKNEIVSMEPDFKVKVNAPPEKGKANKAVIELLSKYFGVKKSQITIIAGEKSRTKTISIGEI